MTDPAVTARLEAVEKSVTTLRSDLANLRSQSDQLAVAVNAPKPATGEPAAAPAVDLSAINARIDQIERSLNTQSDKLGAAVAQASQRAATDASAKAQDDMPLRRVVAAALLDVAVRHNDPFEGALTAAKALAPDPDKLKPLDEFAGKGIPAPPALCRELLTLVPKLSPAAETPSTGSGIIDRLQAGASSLVRVERSDAVGNDRSAVVTRMTAAALRNDLRRSAPRARLARCRRSRAGAGLARQGGRARRRARRVPSIRRRDDGFARQIGAIGFSCFALSCFWC